jgi:hypothetical protein
MVNGQMGMEGLQDSSVLSLSRWEMVVAWAKTVAVEMGRVQRHFGGHPLALTGD